MAAEVKNPGSALPKILVGGSLAVMVLYLLMNVAFLSALTPEEMAGSDLVARDAIAAVFGGTAGTVVVTVEAMKMEHTLTAPVDGAVELLVAAGEQVKVGQLLARITATEEP